MPVRSTHYPATQAVLRCPVTLGNHLFYDLFSEGSEQRLVVFRLRGPVAIWVLLYACAGGGDARGCLGSVTLRLATLLP